MFDTEQELVRHIIKSFDQKSKFFGSLSKNSIDLKCELNLGYGIPDVVIVSKNNINRRKRKTALNYLDVSILDIIKREKEINLFDLVNITKTSKSRLETSLTLLTKEGIIKTHNNGEKIIFNNYEFLCTSCMAIEAKLKDWKRALSQAYRYKWFANKSFVFLPEENMGPAKKNISLFKQFGVGLAGVNEKSEINIIYEPIGEKPISEKMMFLLNEQFLSLKLKSF